MSSGIPFSLLPPMTTAPSQGSQDTIWLDLADTFAAIPDPRNPKGVRHPLGALLSLIVVALLCGEENPERISRFAGANPGLLPLLGFRPTRRPKRDERRGAIVAPSNDMIARALEMVSGEALNEHLARWLGRWSARREVAAIDGKALRGQGGYVLSVYSPASGHVLWQENVGEKENELSALLRALPALCERLGKVRLFTGDAGFCHKEVARLLTERRRDYLLQLKAPHTTDLKLAQNTFEQITAAEPPLAKTAEKKGAREDPKSSSGRSGARRK